MEEEINATLTIEAGEEQGKTFCLDQNTLTMGRGQAEGTIALSSKELVKLGARGIRIDEQARDVWVDGQKLEPTLALKEFDLLFFLCQNRDKACNKDEIASQVWREEFVTDEQIEQCLYHIRKRVELNPSKPNRIITLRGYGYRLVSYIQPQPSPPHTT